MASTHDIAAEDWDSPLSSYGCAAEAAQVYAALAELTPGTCKAQNYELLALAGCQLNPRPGMRASQVLALDVRRDLERAWGAAQAALLLQEGERADELWRVWWAVRVERLSLRAVPEVSKSSAARIVKLVDTVVLLALESLELRRLSVSEERALTLNAQGPRVRVAYSQEE